MIYGFYVNNDELLDMQERMQVSDMGEHLGLLTREQPNGTIFYVPADDEDRADDLYETANLLGFGYRPEVYP